MGDTYTFTMHNMIVENERDDYQVHYVESDFMGQLVEIDHEPCEFAQFPEMQLDCS